MDEASGHDPGVARSVAIIMDGNGRWAAARSLPVAEGTAKAPGHSGARSRPRSTSTSSRLPCTRSPPRTGRARRGGGGDHGASRRDDRPRAPRPRQAGCPHALLREARPRPDSLAGEDGRARGGYGRERPVAALDRVRLRRPGSSRRRGAWSRTGSPPQTCPRTPSSSGCSRPSSRIPTSSSAPRGAAALELPALAVGVRRARVRGHALARLRRGAPARRARGVRAAGAQVRRPLSRQVLHGDRHQLARRVTSLQVTGHELDRR